MIHEAEYRQTGINSLIIVFILRQFFCRLWELSQEMGCLLLTAVGTALLLLILVILWKTSSVARLYLKFTIFAITSMVSATAPIPLMLLRPRDWRNALYVLCFWISTRKSYKIPFVFRIPAAGCRASAKLMGVKCTVKGKENIVKDSGCVVLINHQSALDLLGKYRVYNKKFKANTKIREFQRCRNRTIQLYLSYLFHSFH